MNLAARLEAYVQQANARAFEWRGFNCCHFAGQWVAAVESLDPDPMAAFIALRAPGGLPCDAAGVAALVAGLGGLPGLVSAGLARPAHRAALARLGDVVFFENRGGAGTVGICNGTAAFVPAHHQAAGSIRSVSMSKASLAWRLNL